MGLLPDNTDTRESTADILDRFRIAQGGKPTEAQLRYQQTVKEHIATIAAEINAKVEDSREKSLALTSLEEALMWTGKAIFR